MKQRLETERKFLQAYGVPYMSYLGNYVRWIEYLLPENQGEKLGRKTPFSSHPTKAVRGKLGAVIFLLSDSWSLCVKQATTTKLPARFTSCDIMQTLYKKKIKLNPTKLA